MGTLLRVTGLGGWAKEFDFDGLAALPGQVPDVGEVIPGREGGGVALGDVLDAAGVDSDAEFITLESGVGSFSASVPLESVRDLGLVVYRLGDGPLPVDKGGPVRFYITDVEACGVADVDQCANVKHLARIVVNRQPGRDTRPTTRPEHDALHERESNKN